MENWVNIKNKKLQDLIDNMETIISELDLSNPDKRTKNQKYKKGLETSIKNYKKAIKINESKL